MNSRQPWLTQDPDSKKKNILRIRLRDSRSLHFFLRVPEPRSFERKGVSLQPLSCYNVGPQISP